MNKNIQIRTEDTSTNISKVFKRPNLCFDLKMQRVL